MYICTYMCVCMWACIKIYISVHNFIGDIYIGYIYPSVSIRERYIYIYLFYSLSLGTLTLQWYNLWWWEGSCSEEGRRWFQFWDYAKNLYPFQFSATSPHPRHYSVSQLPSCSSSHYRYLTALGVCPLDLVFCKTTAASPRVCHFTRALYFCGHNVFGIIEVENWWKQELLPQKNAYADTFTAHYS